MRNRLVVTNIAIKKFDGSAIAQKTTKKTTCTTRAHPQTVPGLWLAERIQKNTQELMQHTKYEIGFFSHRNEFFRSLIDALSFSGHENHN